MGWRAVIFCGIASHLTRGRSGVRGGGGPGVPTPSLELAVGLTGGARGCRASGPGGGTVQKPGEASRPRAGGAGHHAASAIASAWRLLIHSRTQPTRHAVVPDDSFTGFGNGAAGLAVPPERGHADLKRNRASRVLGVANQMRCADEGAVWQIVE